VRFARYGRTYQLLIQNAQDLQDVLRLDESLWVATSAPIKAFRCDEQFLKLVDTDHDARIHTEELKAAISWLLERLADVSMLPEGRDELPLSAIGTDTPEGKALVDSARYVLQCQGAAPESISLGQVRRFQASVKARPLNGDGVLVPAAAEDPELRLFIEDVLRCTEPVQDASGQPGITAAHVQKFLDAAARYLAWREKGRIPPGAERTDLMPLGESTPRAYALYRAHADKVESFFARCRLLAFDARAAAQLGPRDEELASLDASDPAAVEEFLLRAPIAEPNAQGALPLREDALNPAYRSWTGALKEQVLRPALGDVPDALTEEAWREVERFFAPYAAYLAAREGAEVERVPPERLERYRDGDFARRTAALLEADRKVAAVMAGVRQLEQLLLYHQNLMRLANNFVSFPELYDRDRRALFEAGSCVMDGRWFNLAVPVDDPAAHKQMARQSSFFTMYLEVTGAAPEERFQVAMPVTAGTRGNLQVGKRGVFFDVRGREYVARIVDILEQPISLQEALVAPFVRIGRFLAGKIESLAGTAEKQLERGIEGTAAVIARPPTAAPTASQRAGMFVGVSVALAALSSALAFIVKTLTGLKLHQIALGVLGVALVVMVPVSIVALVKLRRRDLSALLEGCGWAINARMRLTRAQGRFFSQRRAYPRGARGAPPPAWVRALTWALAGLVVLAGGLCGARRLVTYLQARRAAREAAPAEQQQPSEAPGQPAAPPPAAGQ